MRILLKTGLLFILIIAGCSRNTKDSKIYHVANKYYFSPHLAPGVLPEMQHSGFWIELAEEPDKEILTQTQIDSLNRYISLKRTTRNFDHIDGNPKRIVTYINAAYNSILDMKKQLSQKKLYDKEGRLLEKKMHTEYFYNLPLERTEFDSLIIGHSALMTRFSDERMLPGDYFLSEKPFDDEFNYLQNNALDMGERVFAACFSPDKRWIYQFNESSEGWMKAENFCFLTDSLFLSQFHRGIVQNAYAQLWHNPEKIDFIGAVRMGTTVFIDTTFINNDLYKILLPEADSISSAYIEKFDCILNPKKVTVRNFLTDAFKWLNCPYGWGDTNQFVDCSKMIQKIYAVYGIKLPRNGAAQGKSWINLLSKDTQASVEKNQATLLEKGIPGFTLLQFPGHIMLYLGKYGNEYYALHSMYRYQQMDYGVVSSRVTNRVLVTGLSLGKSDVKPQLIQRISTIVNPGIIYKNSSFKE